MAVRVTQCARPRGPAPARHELTFVGVGTGMRVEVLLPQPTNLFQPRIIIRVESPDAEVNAARRNAASGARSAVASDSDGASLKKV